MNKDIKKIVIHYTKKFGTNDPFEIADRLGILYQMCNIDFEGCYMFLKNHRYIFINGNLDSHTKKIVMAHELGHAILHRKNNCYFIMNKTFLLNSRTEKEANMFAAELLIPDKVILEYKEYSVQQMASVFGCDKALVDIKIEMMDLKNG